MNQGLAESIPKRASKLLSAYAVVAAIAGFAGLAELWGDGGRLALRYDRAAVAAGELWRLITGHLVHLGPSHLAMNVLALAILAVVLPALATWRQWLLTFLSSALFIDIGLFAFHPSVEWYVGLSGVLHGLLFAGLVAGFRRRPLETTVIAGLVAAKLIFEQLSGPLPGLCARRSLPNASASVAVLLMSVLVECL